MKTLITSRPRLLSLFVLLMLTVRSYSTWVAYSTNPGRSADVVDPGYTTSGGLLTSGTLIGHQKLHFGPATKQKLWCEGMTYFAAVSGVGYVSSGQLYSAGDQYADLDPSYDWGVYLERGTSVEFAPGGVVWGTVCGDQTLKYGPGRDAYIKGGEVAVFDQTNNFYLCYGTLSGDQSLYYGTSLTASLKHDHGATFIGGWLETGVLSGTLGTQHTTGFPYAASSAYVYLEGGTGVEFVPGQLTFGVVWETTPLQYLYYNASDRVYLDWNTYFSDTNGGYVKSAPHLAGDQSLKYRASGPNNYVYFRDFYGIEFGESSGLVIDGYLRTSGAIQSLYYNATNTATLKPGTHTMMYEATGNLSFGISSGNQTLNKASGTRAVVEWDELGFVNGYLAYVNGNPA